MTINCYQIPHEYKRSYFDAHTLPDGCALYVCGREIISPTEAVVEALETCGRHDTNIDICKRLREHTGERYTSRQITGEALGEWHIIYFPAKYIKDGTLSDRDIMLIADAYYCLGSEWRVCVDGEDNYTYVTADTETDTLRAQIAAEYGADVASVRMYEFAGYTRTPDYREV